MSSDIVQKVLKSGLVDKSMAELMEKYQLLPEGAADLVQEATREQMEKLVGEVVELSERDAIVKETRFDLERLRWPVVVATGKANRDGTVDTRSLSPHVDGVIDRMGRYYFRVQDVREEWFVPGLLLWRKSNDASKYKYGGEEILEAQKLYIDDQPVAIQVTTREV